QHVMQWLVETLPAETESSAAGRLSPTGRQECLPHVASPAQGLLTSAIGCNAESRRVGAGFWRNSACRRSFEKSPCRGQCRPARVSRPCSPAPDKRRRCARHRAEDHARETRPLHEEGFVAKGAPPPAANGPCKISRAAELLRVRPQVAITIGRAMYFDDPCPDSLKAPSTRWAKGLGSRCSPRGSITPSASLLTATASSGQVGRRDRFIESILRAR